MERSKFPADESEKEKTPDKSPQWESEAVFKLPEKDDSSESTVVEKVEAVLLSTGQVMRLRDIHEALISNPTKASYNSLAAELSRAVQQKRIMRPLRGRYIHPDFYVEGMELPESLLLSLSIEEQAISLLKNIGREMRLEAIHKH